VTKKPLQIALRSRSFGCRDVQRDTTLLLDTQVVTEGVTVYEIWLG
jgi:hypothetical protein